jgi:Ca-activated chloride channel family protein
MDFAAPHALVLFALAVPLAAWTLERRARRRRSELETFGERPLLARSSRLPGGRLAAVRAAAIVLALGLGLLALARPQFGERSTPITRTGRDVLFILDLSRSMNVADVPPSRLEAAKAAVRAILAADPDDRVGLVVFAGSAFLQLPFTLDRSAFEFFLQAAGTEDLADTGSDLGAALTTAATAFGREIDPTYRVAVLVSDGENLEGSVGDAVAQLRYAGVRVFTVGVGTPEGGALPAPPGVVAVAGSPAAGPPGGSPAAGDPAAGDPAAGASLPATDSRAAPAPTYRRNESGAVVISRLREPTLERIAAETGGSYVRYAGGPEIERIAADLSRLEKRQVSSRSMSRLAERFQWPLALALLLLAGETLLAERRRAPKPGDGETRQPAGEG